MDQTISRRELGRFGAAAASLAAFSLAGRSALAQEDDAQPIQSTVSGDMPTTGGLRPGPVGLEPNPLAAAGAKPVSIQIDAAQVSAEIETIEIVNGVMQNPTGPWIVSWYRETARLGGEGNVVMAGHLDYWDVGPAVFYNIGALGQGEIIQVTGDDDLTYEYEVDWNQLFDAANAPIDEIVGPTDKEALTLITCGGPFDYETGEYLQRTVVRSYRVVS